MALDATALTSGAVTCATKPGAFGAGALGGIGRVEYCFCGVCIGFDFLILEYRMDVVRRVVGDDSRVMNLSDYSCCRRAQPLSYPNTECAFEAELTQLRVLMSSES